MTQQTTPVKKSVSMRGLTDMMLSIRKIGNKADYFLSWTVDGREMQGITYHGKKNAVKVFNEIHANYNDKVKWFDAIK